MKKLIAILLAIVLVFALCACSGGQSNTGSGENRPSSSANDRTEAGEESEDETSSLVLSGEDNWVVVCGKGRGESLKINSLEELKDKKVSFAYETEAEQIATYYGAELHGAGGTLDALTLIGTVTDYAIVPDYSTADFEVDIVFEIKLP